MLDLNEIVRTCGEFEKQCGHARTLKASINAQWDFLDRARTWLSALVEELREARATITELRERNGRLVAVLHTDEAEIERLRTLMGWQPEDGRKSWPRALHSGGESNE